MTFTELNQFLDKLQARLAAKPEPRLAAEFRTSPAGMAWLREQIPGVADDAAAIALPNFSSIPINVDEKLPANRIEVRDAQGKLITSIVIGDKPVPV